MLAFNIMETLNFMEIVVARINKVCDNSPGLMYLVANDIMLWRFASHRKYFYSCDIYKAAEYISSKLSFTVVENPN